MRNISWSSFKLYLAVFLIKPAAFVLLTAATDLLRAVTAAADRLPGHLPAHAARCSPARLGRPGWASRPAASLPPSPAWWTVADAVVVPSSLPVVRAG